MSNLGKILKHKKKCPNESQGIAKKVTTKETEIWEVTGLNFCIEPSSRSSEVLEKLAEKRRKHHDELLNKFTHRLNEINLAVEKNIRTSSIEFKAHLKYYDDELNETLKSLDNPEALEQSNELLKSVQKKTNNYKSKLQTILNELYEDLNSFEDNRIQRTEKFFHEICEDIRKNGHLLPYQLQSFIEKETLKMNQLSLNNRRCFNDLKLTLSLLMEQMFKTFCDKFLCMQEKWAEWKIQKAIFNTEEEVDNKANEVPPSKYVRLELTGLELTIKSSPDDIYSMCNVTTWFNNINKITKVIENYGHSLLDLYKKTLLAVFHNFDNEVKSIKEELSTFEDMEFTKRTIKPLMFEAESKQKRELETLEMLWQENLVEINTTIKDVSEFLHDVGNIWNTHNERLCETKKIILKALEKDDENNQVFFQDLEVKLNQAIDALRQEHVAAKMDKAYETVVLILKSIKEKYESVYLKQVAMIEDFYEMMNLEAEILTAELSEFIYQIHPAESDRFSHQLNTQCNSFCEGLFINKEIQKCCHQIRILRTWKHGVWIALETFTFKARESLQPRAETWVQSKIDNLAEKFTLELEILQKRSERIKVEIFEKRLSEIQLHQKVYDSHQEAIKLEIKKIKSDLEALANSEENKINEIVEDLYQIGLNSILENRPEVLKKNQIKMEKAKRELEEKLQSSYEMFKTDCEIKMGNIKQANINYMKGIKLFHEGGKYSADEAKALIAQLETIDKEINGEIKNINKDIARDENEMSKKFYSAVSSTIALVQKLYEETLFNSTVEKKLLEFKEKVQKIIDGLRLDFRRLQCELKCFKKLLCNENKETLETSNYKHWWPLLSILYKNISNLFYPLKISVTPTVSNENSQDESESNEGEESNCLNFPCSGNPRYFPKAIIAKSPFLRPDDAQNNFTCLNCNWELFNTKDPPLNDGTFPALINNCFWSDLDFIQNIACDFYKKMENETIKRNDLIPLTYEVFAKETIPKFKACKTQCEKIWLQTILDFLPILQEIKLMANNYFKMQLDNYEEAIFSVLNEFENDFVMSLENQILKNEKTFKYLENKLLPLYGNPKNRHLLEALEEEVVNKTANMSIEWDDEIQKFRNQLNCFGIYHIKEQSGTYKIQIEYFNLKDRIFLEDLGDRILDLILEYSEKDEFKIDPDTDAGANEESFNDYCNFKICNNTNKLLNVPSYISLLLNYVKEARFEPHYDFKTPNNFTFCESTEFSFNRHKQKVDILLPPYDAMTYMYDIYKRASQKIKKLLNLADSKVNLQEERMFKWLDVWKFNVKKIRKLYTVKYEEKPVVEEQILPTFDSHQSLRDNDCRNLWHLF